MQYDKKSPNKIGLLSLTALGIVFGDIGTSPLYAVRECFFGSFSVEPNTANILGVISLIFWSLIIVISLKYLIVILRADNQGEGGILALMHLVLPQKKEKTKYAIMLAMGLFGAALLYGDGMITPAISVLSAIEGLKVATSVFNSFVIPITISILIILFIFQKRGTKNVGFVFGPLILIWFIIITILGFSAIIKNPEILVAINPYYAVKFFLIHNWHGIFILGAIFLVITGGEALYADLGHFGKKPIRLAWFAIVLPSLLINYFGQGALLLGNAKFAINPFYHLAPQWAIYPLVVLATIATVIASQAIISGAFSLTFQAMQLGYFPRVNIIHTSADERGQIYIPQINWILFLGAAGLVLSFKSSTNLAAAYGVAVSTTMVITTLLAFFAIHNLWRWKLSTTTLVILFLLFIDLSFFSANISKIPEGGWFPILFAAGIYLIMTTWFKGRRIVQKEYRKLTGVLNNFIKKYKENPSARVKGTAIYFVSKTDFTPAALLLNLKHNKVVHDQVIILSVIFKSMAHIPIERRLKFIDLGNGFYKANIYYGFMDIKDIPQAFDLIREKVKLNIESEITYVLGRETLITEGKKGMTIWRETVFAFLLRNSQRATKYFNLPNNQVLEIGSQIKI